MTAMPDRARLELVKIAKAYGEDDDRQAVIGDVSFTVEPGEVTALIGPSGCGKTTLVNLVAGFTTPNAGAIRFNGKAVTGPGRERMVVFQESTLLPWLTTYGNVVFGPKVRGDLRGRALHQKAMQLLQRVGLAEFKDKYPGQLSGGMQRRAELARALINDPAIMIMDEPFRGLDAMTRELMQEFFLRLFEENRRTVLFVTSEVEEALFLADRLVILGNRPARVRDIIRVPLPRPRDFHMLSSPAAYEVKAHALALLHDEALRTFAMRLPGRLVS